MQSWVGSCVYSYIVISTHAADSNTQYTAAHGMVIPFYTILALECSLRLPKYVWGGVYILHSLLSFIMWVLLLSHIVTKRHDLISQFSLDCAIGSSGVFWAHEEWQQSLDTPQHVPQLTCFIYVWCAYNRLCTAITEFSKRMFANTLYTTSVH